MRYTSRGGFISIAQKELHSSGLRGLGAAIVLQAADDWRVAQRSGEVIRLNNVDTVRRDELIAECEEFLTSDYCELICPGVGPRILARLREGK